MKYNFPKFKLTVPQRIWMEKIYSYQKKGKQITYRQLISELYGKIPDDFNPDSINSKLIYGTDKLTLLGIWHIAPKTNLIEKTDKVIKHIRMKLIKNPELNEIKTEVISKEMGISKKEISLIFGLISHLGTFWNSAGGSGELEYEHITIDPYNAFKEYFKYKNIEKLINDFYNIKEYKATGHDLYRFDDDSDDEFEENPYFRSVIEQIDYKLCFVLMPMSEKWSNRVYKELIKKTVENFGIQCLRADNLTGQIIIEDIWIKINQSAFVIADITTRNPNVMYELGIVHAIGTPSILITQNLKDIPFDFKHYRQYEYQDNIDGFKELELKLPEVVKDLYREFYPEFSLDNLNL